MVNFSVFALSHVSKHVSCARTYLKHVRAREASLAGFFLLQDVADDEIYHFPMLRKLAGRLGEVRGGEKTRIMTIDALTAFFINLLPDRSAQGVPEVSKSKGYINQEKMCL